MKEVKKAKPFKTITTKEAKTVFTVINRAASDEDEAFLITKRGKPSTVLLSVKRMKELIGEEKFKEFLFDAYYKNEIEKRLGRFIEEKEKLISVEELKKKMGK
ncbi:MAG: type II toxin-antitoxin system prevent-host-death family antitoxin [Nitrososphaeria archaeon]